MRGKIRSYVAVVYARTGVLIGGVKVHRSSRFKTATAAMSWRDTVVATNMAAGRDVGAVTVNPSRLGPEILE